MSWSQVRPGTSPVSPTFLNIRILTINRDAWILIADYTISYFSELLTSEDDARRREARRLADEISSWAAVSYGLITLVSFSQNVMFDTLPCNVLQNAEQPTQRALLAAHLPTVLRLAWQCPFHDLKDDFAQLLETLPVCSPRIFNNTCSVHSGCDAYAPVQ